MKSTPLFSNALRLATCGLAIVCVFSCDRDDDIATYQAPKETAVASAPQFAMANAPSAEPAAEPQAPISWTVPSGWKQMPGSQMRFATFQVSDANPNAQLTVIPLGPESGSLLPNLNRWEQQLGLPPSSETEAPKKVVEVKLPDATAYTVDLANKQERMLAAIIPHADRIWFFKLVGPAANVSPQKENFDAFIKSIHFGGGGGAGAAPANPQAKAGPQELPAGHPALPQDNSQQQLPSGHPALPSDGAQQLPSGHPALPADGNAAAKSNAEFLNQPQSNSELKMAPNWKLPNDWTEEPPRPMRAVSYLIDTTGQKGEVIVTKMDASHFGTLLSNINRWRGQVHLDPLADESAIKPEIVKINGKDFSFFDFAGPKNESGVVPRIMVTMLVNGPDVWFFKLQGPDELVSKERKAFESFLGAAQFQGAQ